MRVDYSNLFALLLEIDAAGGPIPVQYLRGKSAGDSGEIKSDLHLLRAVGLIEFDTPDERIVRINRKGQALVSLLRGQPDLLDSGFMSDALAA